MFSEINQSQKGQILDDSIYMRYLKYQGLEKGDKGELFNGYRVSVLLDAESNKVLNIYIIAM